MIPMWLAIYTPDLEEKSSRSESGRGLYLTGSNSRTRQQLMYEESFSRSVLGSICYSFSAREIRSRSSGRGSG